MNIHIDFVDFIRFYLGVAVLVFGVLITFYPFDKVQYERVPIVLASVILAIGWFPLLVSLLIDKSRKIK